MNPELVKILEKKMLTDKEIEALEVVIGTLNDCWYRDVLQSLLKKEQA